MSKNNTNSTFNSILASVKEKAHFFASVDASASIPTKDGKQKDIKLLNTLEQIEKHIEYVDCMHVFIQSDKNGKVSRFTIRNAKTTCKLRLFKDFPETQVILPNDIDERHDIAHIKTTENVINDCIEIALNHYCYQLMTDKQIELIASQKGRKTSTKKSASKEKKNTSASKGKKKEEQNA